MRSCLLTSPSLLNMETFHSAARATITELDPQANLNRSISLNFFISPEPPLQASISEITIANIDTYVSVHCAVDIGVTRQVSQVVGIQLVMSAIKGSDIIVSNVTVRDVMGGHPNDLL